jgi:hypothetical protein
MYWFISENHDKHRYNVLWEMQRVLMLNHMVKEIYRFLTFVYPHIYHSSGLYQSLCLLFKTQLYRLARTSQETHYVSVTSPAG